MTYKQSLAWLYGLEGHGIKLGLSNIRKLLEHFSSPHLSYPVILIAGTNGKGSVASFIAHILCESGLKIGLYTSPHLITIRERITVLQGDKKTDIPRKSFANIAGELKKEIKKIFDCPPYSRPTFFEVLTALSFIYFQEKKIDAAVYEVGLGGRLDATNVSEPVISVITGIGLEHTNYLGKTLSSIAKEKGGIIRENTPLVTGAEGEALDTLIELAKAKKAPFFMYGKDFAAENIKEENSRQVLDIRGIKDFYPGVLLNLKGKWQHTNASLAVAAAEILSAYAEDRDSKTMDGCTNDGLCFGEMSPLRRADLAKARRAKAGRTGAPSKKFHIKKEHIYKGLGKTTWPGRLEKIGSRPSFILDGAHNPQAAKILKEEIIKLKSAGLNIKMIFGVLKDKDREKMMKEMFPVANEIILVKPNNKRAVPLSILKKEGKNYNEKITTSRNLSATIKELREKKEENDIIFVCGSLYLVGEARSILLKKKQE